HNANSPKFACSSFKDIHALLAADEATASGQNVADSAPICHRNRAVKHLVRTLSQPAPPRIESAIGIPGAEDAVVVYFTSLRVVRRTFDDCKAVRSILRSFRVRIDERDVTMDSGFMAELQRIFDQRQLSLPRVFIAGRYVGGAEEIRRLHECGELKKLVQGLPTATDLGTCDACGGYGFLPCYDCGGSHKCYHGEKSGFRSCTSCNENGLVRCSFCSSSPL
ncbi:hypothetical protein M569_04523, partial [Genlisea aurea]